jgi:hypothetical protein
MEKRVFLAIFLSFAVLAATSFGVYGAANQALPAAPPASFPPVKPASPGPIPRPEKTLLPPAAPE